MSNQIIEFGPDKELTPEIIYKIAYNPTIKVKLSPSAKTKILASRKVVEKMVKEKQIVYGITTGFGSFKNKYIGTDQVEELQRNLIRSHSSGVGNLLAAEMVRAALLVRLNSLTKGFSGVRMDLIDLVIGLINTNIIPVVPSQGSVGSSGDLAPLSHMGLPLMGEGEVFFRGERMPSAKALKKAGLKPITFSAKEGLAWNNGTSVMTGIAAVLMARALKVIDRADLACALTMESLCAVSGALDQRIHKIRPHQGQIAAAQNISKFIKGSKLIDSVPDRIQDAYSLRCSPQVHGAARDALAYVYNTVLIEINSVTDNPLIFTDTSTAVSGGNFHGEPIAIAMDTFGIAISEIANISERRTAKLVDSSTNEGLPMFLISKDKGGLHSGFMIPQYAAAALVSENKVLAHPASVDSIPTSANQEDHVSMGTIAARKAANILDNAENVLAIELYTAAQAIDFRGPKKLGKLTSAAYKSIRKQVKYLEADREMASDIQKVRAAMFSGTD